MNDVTYIKRLCECYYMLAFAYSHTKSGLETGTANPTSWNYVPSPFESGL